MKTIKRTIPEIEDDIDNYTKYNNQVEFKGIIETENIYATDQSSQADAQNVYVDWKNKLVSRPALQMEDLPEDVKKQIAQYWGANGIFSYSDVFVKEVIPVANNFVYIIYNSYSAGDYYICYYDTELKRAFFIRNGNTQITPTKLPNPSFYSNYRIVIYKHYVILLAQKGQYANDGISMILDINKEVDSSGEFMVNFPYSYPETEYSINYNRWEALSNYIEIPVAEIYTGSTKTTSYKNYLTPLYYQQYIVSNEFDFNRYNWTSTYSNFKSINDGETVLVNSPEVKGIDNLNEEYTYGVDLSADSTGKADFSKYVLFTKKQLPKEIINTVSVGRSAGGQTVICYHSENAFYVSYDGGVSFSYVIYPSYTGDFLKGSISEDATTFFFVTSYAVYRCNLGDLTWYDPLVAQRVSNEPSAGDGELVEREIYGTIGYLYCFKTAEIFSFVTTKSTSGYKYLYFKGPGLWERGNISLTSDVFTYITTVGTGNENTLQNTITSEPIIDDRRVMRMTTFTDAEGETATAIGIMINEDGDSDSTDPSSKAGHPKMIVIFGGANSWTTDNNGRMAYFTSSYSNTFTNNTYIFNVGVFNEFRAADVSDLITTSDETAFEVGIYVDMIGLNTNIYQIAYEKTSGSSWSTTGGMHRIIGAVTITGYFWIKTTGSTGGRWGVKTNLFPNMGEIITYYKGTDSTTILTLDTYFKNGGIIPIKGDNVYLWTPGSNTTYGTDRTSYFDLDTGSYVYNNMSGRWYICSIGALKDYSDVDATTYGNDINNQSYWYWLNSDFIYISNYKVFVLDDQYYYIFSKKKSASSVNMITNEYLDDEQLRVNRVQEDDTYEMTNVGLPDCYYTDDNEIYFGYNNYFRITQNTTDSEGNLLLYLPTVTEQVFGAPITNISNISTTEIAIFFKNKIKVCEKTTDDETVGTRYDYYDTKLSTGTRSGDTVMSILEGTYTVFPTQRGLAAMNYQAFMSTTDQSLTYLTDNVKSLWNDFYNNGTIKIIQWRHWLVLFNNTQTILLYDLDNTAWWKWKVPYNVFQAYTDQVDLYTLTERAMTYKSTQREYYDSDAEDWYIETKFTLNTGNCKFDEDCTNYSDFSEIGENNTITWYIMSQPLYLGAPTYYKNLRQLVFSFGNNNDDSELSKTLDAQIKLYRKRLTVRDPELVQFKIANLRTFVKRFNYWKINEVQWALGNDDETDIPQKLELNGISIKYELGEEVR